jgi:lysophospholipase L1-like esterase
MALLGSPLFTVLDDDGLPISGAKVYFYLTGTTIASDVYQSNQTTPLTQPVVTAATGRLPDVYLDPDVTYKVVIKSAADVLIRTIDPVVSGGGGGGTVTPTPQTIYFGDVPPTDDIGANGDVYLDTETGIFYGPKTSDAWPVKSFSFASVNLDNAFPTGALVALDISTYDTGTASIKNILEAAAVEANILRAPVGLFTNTVFYASSNCTTTQQVDGSANLAITSGGFLQPVNIDLPAGQYTLGITAKRNTGSDQSFNLGVTGVSTSATKTATSVYQDFSHTFTLASPTTVTMWVAGTVTIGGTADLNVKNARLTVGAADAPLGNRKGDCYMGIQYYDPENTGIYAGGKVDLSAGGWGMFQLPSAVTITRFTVTCLAKKLATSTTGTVPGGDYQALIAKVGSAWQDFAVCFEQPAGQMATYFSTMVPRLWELFPGAPQDLEAEEYHSFTWRYNQSTIDLFFDGLLYNSFPVAAYAPVTIQHMFLGLILASNLSGTYGLAGQMRIWDRALTDAECRTTHTAQVSAAPTASITAPVYTWVADGDSITGSYAYSYPYATVAALSPKTYLAKRANTSLFLTNLENRLTSLTALIPPSKAGKKFVYSVLIGANDATTIIADPVAYGNRLASYLDDVRAAGFDEIIVGTVLPRVETLNVLVQWTAFNTARATLNAIIRTWVGTHADAIMDFAADPVVGVDSACTNATYYADGLHPTSLTHNTYLAPISTAAVQAFVP